MAKAKTRRRAGSQRPARQLKPVARSRSRWRLRWFAGAAVLALIAAGAFLIAKNQADEASESVSPAATGLPETPDYHSLLVTPADSQHVLLGTHAGLYESTDGGRSWSVGELEGQDAMNLVPAGESVVWAAGHDVLARSEDGGTSWSDVRPDGLPSLDLHGFARDPRDPNRLYVSPAKGSIARMTAAGRSSSSPRTSGRPCSASPFWRTGRSLPETLDAG